jgi:hypothetical protein
MTSNIISGKLDEDLVAASVRVIDVISWVNENFIH